MHSDCCFGCNSSSSTTLSEEITDQDLQVGGYLRFMNVERGRNIPLFRPPIVPGWSRRIAVGQTDSLETDSDESINSCNVESESSDSTLQRAYDRALDTVTHPFSRATFAYLYDIIHPPSGATMHPPTDSFAAQIIHGNHVQGSVVVPPIRPSGWEADAEDTVGSTTASSEQSVSTESASNSIQWQELANLRSNTSVSAFPRWFHIRPELSPRGEISVQATRPFIRNLQGRLSSHAPDV